GQRIRSAVRRHLRLLRHDGAGRRHPDPRDRRRPDGNQLPARRTARPGRQGVLLQTHAARSGAQARHVRHLHGQADGGRAGLGDAANPYLALAVTLACGYLGITEQIEPTPMVEGSAYKMKVELPQGLPEALALLRGEVRLREVLGDRFIDVYSAVKDLEHQEF